MKIHIQHLSSVIRIWHSDEAEYGDPYDWAATIRWIDNETIELLGVDKKITKEMWIAMQDAFYNMGILEIVAIRHTGGKERERRIKTRRKRD
jgi:hypothetical protein